MEVSVYTTQELENNLDRIELQRLISRFKLYKETGDPDDTFGRDVRFEYPQSAKESLKHMHMSDSGKWGKRFDKPALIVRQFSRTSDKALVYSQGFMDENAYLLITIVNDGAHAKWRDRSFLSKLLDIAEEFREEF